MPAHIGALSILLFLAMVLTRVANLKARGIGAMKFARTDKSDFAIPPFALFYVYLVCAGAFGWPALRLNLIFDSGFLAWLGALLCISALCFMALAIVSFGTSFRVGIDTDKPGELVTNGIFGITRNPLYVAFALMLAGEFLIFPTRVMLLYLLAGVALFHRQVLREEQYLSAHYGAAYEEYRRHVPRYL